MRVVVVVPAFTKVSNATHQLLVDMSLVTKRREPQLWVAEFTSQVVCSPITVRKKTPHSRNGRPPSPAAPRQADHGDVVILRNPDVKFVLGQVRNIAGQGGGVVVHRLAGQNPSHMCPPLPSRGECGSPS